MQKVDAARRDLASALKKRNHPTPRICVRTAQRVSAKKAKPSA